MSDERYVDESWKDDVAKEKKETVHPASSGNKSTSDSKKPPLSAKKDSRDKGEDAVFPTQGDDLDNEQVPGEENYDLNFIGYITSLAYQAMVFLGEVPNPIDNTMQKNLDQARLLIDTLAMLREKTKGNLNAQEDQALNQIVYELQMKYVDSARAEAK